MDNIHPCTRSKMIFILEFFLEVIRDEPVDGVIPVTRTVVLTVVLSH